MSGALERGLAAGSHSLAPADPQNPTGGQNTGISAQAHQGRSSLRQPRMQGPPIWAARAGAEQPGHTPGDLGQDLLDADDELLVLGRVALDGAMQPGHVEVQRAECGSLARAWRPWGERTDQPNPTGRRGCRRGLGSTGAQVRGSGSLRTGSWGGGPWRMSERVKGIWTRES